jgi:para-aminobenzoate synthetase/4-amino-4-deoxychorismate lyase
VWFGLYPSIQQLRSEDLSTGGELPEGAWEADISQARYLKAIEQIKAAIARGDTYQVNYTYRLRSRLHAPAWPIFASLASAHAAPYAAFVETEEWAVCSISPEMFFTLEGNTLSSRPMKGTAQRGLLNEDDLAMGTWLQNSEKNRAENVMIVDMARNDLGRIARTGSVRVPDLFRVEKYPTVWQMTSLVQAETDARMAEIFAALFPAASITGAPKIRTMEIIAELENSPRQLYTGTIGYFTAERKAQFNVAIRTLLIDKRNGRAEYGTGGGIVWDSQADSEWEETRTKARILHEEPQKFDLLETMRWDPEDGWFLIDLHLTRLGRSAEYFDYAYDEDTVRGALHEAEARFAPEAQRVRLTLKPNGRTRIEHTPLNPMPRYWKVGLARTPVDAENRFLYHKTAHRVIYENAMAECPGCQDALLFNREGELTESCIANLFLEIEGELLTPPGEAGLLPGIYREWLLALGRATEQTLRIEDLRRAERVWLANSVRGMWEAQVEIERALTAGI